METKIIGSFTEIYTSGGGNFLTQSYPTNFHSFYKSKMLTESERIEDYKEVSEAEKTALEKADAGFVAPPQSFIDLWNEACRIDSKVVGRYNHLTGYFELNGLMDITYKQALLIYNAPRIRSSFGSDRSNQWLFYPYREGLRTVIPYNCFRNSCCNYTFFNCHDLEVVTGTAIEPLEMCFFGCSKLHTINIYKPVGITSHEARQCYERCYSLKNITVEIVNENHPIYLSDSPLITIDSFNNILVKTTQAVIDKGGYYIFVHPDVYAKLIDESNTEWHRVMTDAATKNIQFATT